MKIPNVPIEKFINEHGDINHTWIAFFQNLITQLRLNVSDEGYVFPFLDNANILELNTTENIGKILYNTTTQRMMVNNSGTFENIQT